MSEKKELYRLSLVFKVNCVAFHNDLLITACHDSLCLWKKSRGDLLHSLVHTGTCSTFDISSDGTMIAVVHTGWIQGKHTGWVTIWSLTTYNKITELELASPDVNAVFFQTNEKLIATVHSMSSRNGQVYLITAY